MLDECNVYQWENPVIAWLAAISFFWDVRLLDSYNAMVEILVRHVYFHRIGRTSLAFVSFGAASEKREAGSGSLVYGLRNSFEDGINERFDYGFDSTLYHISALKMLRIETERLKDTINELSTREVSPCEKIGQLASLNLRQQEILQRLVKDPLGSVVIADHQEKHRLAYSTARADCVGLEDMGFLRMTKRGHRYLFIPTEKLFKL